MSISVQFADQSSAGPSGPITAWDWNFGDGASHGTTQNPSHTYTAAGTYTVTLQVTGTSPDGTSTVSHNITLSDTPTPPPSGPYGGTPGIGALEYGGNLTHLSNPNTYNLLIGSSFTSDVTILESAAGLTLTYFTPTVVSTAFNTGVTYTAAQSNNWLLKNSGGSTLPARGFPNNYAAAIGNTSYQNAFINSILNYLQSHPGLGGVFLDTILYNPLYDFGYYPTAYPDQSSWETAMLSCLSAIHTALSAKGYYMCCNAIGYISGDPGSNNGNNEVTWWTALDGHCDGMMNEYYIETSTGTNQLRANGTAWYQNWAGYNRLIGVAQGQGQDFVGLNYGSAGNTAAMQYGKASFLMEWNGNGLGEGGGGAFIYKSGSSDPYSTAWTKDMGAPSGAKTAVGVGYRRDFANGTAIINPSATSSQAFTVSGTTYTLAPTTAKIL